MSVQQVGSFAAGEWLAPGGGARPIASAITGKVIAEAGNDALNASGDAGVCARAGRPGLAGDDIPSAGKDAEGAGALSQ